MVAVGIAVMLILVFVGMPLWGAIFGGALIMVVAGWHLDPTLITSVMFDRVTSIGLIAVPLFVFSGMVMVPAGATRPLLEVFIKFLGHLPGGPAYVVIFANAMFGAMSSSSAAALAGFAPIMIPMMTQMGYSKKFSVGLLMAATCLAPLIPPSIPLILYGIITETSIRDLYAAGFVPGFMLAGLLGITVYIHTKRGHYTPPPAANWEERWRSLWRGIPVLLFPVILIVPMYTGVFTPTEAGAVASVYSVFLGFVVYRKLTLKSTWEAAVRTAMLMSMIFAIVMSAFLLSFTFSFVRIPFALNDMLAGAGLSQYTFLLVIIIVFAIMGMFLDPGAILLISPPILMPTILSLGIDPVVFGVLVVFSVELAGITPPYGMHIFIATAVLKEKFAFIARSCILFYPSLIIGQFLIAYVPQISLFLPNLLY